jgi:sortase B
VLYDGTNEYYLQHDIDGNKTVAASIMMDASNDIEQDNYNILLHGHHMKNGTMFKDLVKYKVKDFFENNRIIHFDTLYDDMLWEVFSVYVIDAGDETILTDYLGNPTLYKMFLEKYAERSMYAVDGLEFKSTDRILTLSTCSYETKNSRTLVHARLISKNGELVAQPTVDLK